MQLSLRLYYPADADLIAIRVRLGRNFGVMIRDTLEQYLSGGNPRYDMPDNISRFVRPIEHPIIVNIIFKEGRDDKAILFFQNISKSHRTNIIKTLIRGSYSYFPTDLFIELVPASANTTAQNKKAVPKKRSPTSVNQVLLSEMEESEKAEKESTPKEELSQKDLLIPEAAVSIPDKEKRNPDKVIEKSKNSQDIIPAEETKKTESQKDVKSSSDFSEEDDDGAAFEMFSNLM